MKKIVVFVFLAFSFCGLNAQKISPDEVMKEVAKGKPFTLVLFKTGTALPKEEQLVQKMQMDHLVHLFQMQKDGKISIFGPVTTDSILRGRQG